MRSYIERACEEIDAAFFSGDGFDDEESLKEIKFYVSRWQRKIKENKKWLKEEKEKLQ